MILHLRPSQKAMCEKWQPYSSRILPPSSGRRCPEGAEVGFRCGIEKQCEMCLSRFVIPSAAEGSFSFPISVFLCNAVCMKHRAPKSHKARFFPFPASLTASPDRERKRFLAFARNDNMGGRRLGYREVAFSFLAPQSQEVRCFPFPAFLTVFS